MGWGSDYIPDLTQRFPEGFGGVDMTSRYYPSAYDGYEYMEMMDKMDSVYDMPMDYEVVWYVDGKQYAGEMDSLEEAKQIAQEKGGIVRKYNHDTEEWEDYEEKPKRFQIGQVYDWTDWFSGGQAWYTVKEVADGKVVFAEHRWELDGEFDLISDYEIKIDENGNEYIVMCSYHEHEGRIYAEE